MANLHTIGAYTYKVCGDGAVTIASGPSGTAGLTYAAGSEAARDVLAMINQGAATTLETGHSESGLSGGYEALTDYSLAGYGATADNWRNFFYITGDSKSTNYLNHGQTGSEQASVTLYTVKPGDSLTKIALAYTGDMSRYKEILAVNTIADPNRIEVGQQIVLPQSWVSGGSSLTSSGGAGASFTGRGGGSSAGGSTFRPDFWSTAAKGVETFMPLIQTGIQELTAGRRNSAAVIAGQIAKKQQQLTRTSDPVKRAQLQAEISSLQQQQAAYAQLLTQGTPPPAADLTTSSSSVSSWVPWAVLGVGGVLALAAITASSGKKARA